MVCPWKKPLLFLSSSALLITVYSVPPFLSLSPFPFPLSPFLFPSSPLSLLLPLSSLLLSSLPFLPILFLPFSFPFSLSPLVLRPLCSPLLFSPLLSSPLLSSPLIFCLNENNCADPKEHILDFSKFHIFNYFYFSTLETGVIRPTSRVLIHA